MILSPFILVRPYDISNSCRLSEIYIFIFLFTTLMIQCTIYFLKMEVRGVARRDCLLRGLFPFAFAESPNKHMGLSLSSSSSSSSSLPSPLPSSLRSSTTTSCHVPTPLLMSYCSFSSLISTSSSVDSSTANISSSSFTYAMHVSCSWRINHTSRSYVSSWAHKVSILQRRASRNMHSAPTALAAQTRLTTSLFPGSTIQVSTDNTSVTMDLPNVRAFRAFLARPFI